MLCLLDKLDGPKERVGYILKNGEIVEVENICEDPENGFDVKGEDLLKWPPLAAATWHTHPGQTSNLSGADYAGFQYYPDLLHYIVGTDGVSCYRVVGSKVMRHEA